VRRGLVLGAGGVLGAAWTIGALSAVQEELGWEPREAEVLIGTSAGSVLASALACGITIEELLDHQNGRPDPRIAFDPDSDSGGALPRLPRPFVGSPRGVLHSALHPWKTTPMGALAAALPERATLFVGSSMAIRDVDTFWPAAPPGRQVLGNRGASGIDGLVSTGLGVAAVQPGPAAILLGDLSLYHDMNGLWAVGRHGLRATFVVLDNDGGGIFSFLPQAEHEDVFEELFGTPLGLRLEDVARLYGLEFCSVARAADLEAALQVAFSAEGAAMVAVRFGRADSVSGHRACWAAVAEALGREGAQ